jgi:diguanylate cyclase (GGDEF)-like protein/PAS domain S-box-containing protein
VSQSDFTAEPGLFQQLFESSPDPAWIIAGARFIKCNQAAIRTLGHTNSSDLLNLHPAKLSPRLQPDGEESVIKADRMMAIAREQGFHRFEWIHTKADGSNFVAEVTLSVITVNDKQLTYCVWRDVAERQRSELARIASENQLRLFYELDLVGLTITSPTKGWIHVNKALCSMLEYSEAELRAMTWAQLTHPDDLAADVEQFDRLLAGEINGYQLEKRFVARSGRIVPTNLVVRCIRKTNGEVDLVAAMVEDISVRKQMEEQVHQLAFFDPLTKLANRRMLKDRLSKAMAASKRSARYGAVMVLDLDNFKPLNDRHGHLAGDLLLIDVARRMLSCVREADTVARLGGDEFVVMLGELDTDKAESASQAQQIAEKVRGTLSVPYRLTLKEEGGAGSVVEHRCSASIGVVLFVSHEISQEDILKWADAAMYRAKDEGRNAIRFYPATGQA